MNTEILELTLAIDKMIEQLNYDNDKLRGTEYLFSTDELKEKFTKYYDLAENAENLINAIIDREEIIEAWLDQLKTKEQS